ncbi:hypothetical protein [Tahibacter amnicola]|uniref:Uncharacterized protein n=1 Tax=Tahibacter amnicola TaxID=2976241 RepID=A0ABY6BD32_9GAMM|nr:hypothetical protein [Tahibacter amnicola]UXI67958.1 hypothetical protein N4264_25060 [Tahibacter amnicola]
MSANAGGTVSREHELSLRLAEAAYTEEQLRRVIAQLLEEADAVFASRSWRIGRGLTALAGRLLGLVGIRLPTAQDAGHWRRIVAAHDDVLRRRRLLLERLVADAAVREGDLDSVLAQLWTAVGEESALRPGPPA